MMKNRLRTRSALESGQPGAFCIKGARAGRVGPPGLKTCMAPEGRTYLGVATMMRMRPPAGNFMLSYQALRE